MSQLQEDGIDCSRVTRFEVIDHSKRGNVTHDPDVPRSVVAHRVSVELSVQDAGRTLKVFLGDRGED